MYKIIGADGKEYGPITADILKKWIADGRANAQTRVQLEGTTEWRTLGEFPELAAAVPTIAPLSTPTSSASLVSATDQANGPGIGLIVTGALNILLGLVRAAVSVFFGAAMSGMAPSSGPDAEFQKIVMMASGTMGVVFGLLGAACGGLTLFAGIKLRKLESYGLCMTGAILGLLPCTSPCCLVGLPIGIWAIVVMSKGEVKSQFT